MLTHRSATVSNVLRPLIHMPQDHTHPEGGVGSNTQPTVFGIVNCLMRADDRIRPVVMLRGWMFDQPGNHDEQHHEQEHKVDPEFHWRVFVPFDAPQLLARSSVDLSSARSAEMRAAVGEVLPRASHWSAGDY